MLADGVEGVKERPILFSGEMVRAIQRGKSQTRRLVKPQPEWRDGRLWWRVNDAHEASIDPGFNNDVAHGVIEACPYGAVGDRLWVRETWQYYDWNDEGEPCIRYAADNDTAWQEPGHEEWSDRLLDIWSALSLPDNYDIDNRASDRRWRPSIHMPRWACRLVLEIVDVRVERLQSISAADCWAEGIPHSPDVNPVHEYEELWDSLNAKRAPWASNPWVWVLTFRVLR